MKRCRKLLLGGLVVLMAAGAPTRTGEGADPYLPSHGPMQSWAQKAYWRTYIAKIFLDAARGPYEQCEEDDRLLGSVFTYTRLDGKRCLYYGIYMEIRSDLYSIFAAGLAPCSVLDSQPFVRDPERPLTCEQLERDFGGGGE